MNKSDEDKKIDSIRDLAIKEGWLKESFKLTKGSYLDLIVEGIKEFIIIKLPDLLRVNFLYNQVQSTIIGSYPATFELNRIIHTKVRKGKLLPPQLSLPTYNLEIKINEKALNSTFVYKLDNYDPNINYTKYFLINDIKLDVIQG